VTEVEQGPPVHVSEVLHIEPPPPPWWFRPVAAVAVVCLVATLLLFAVTSWQGGRDTRGALDDARHEAAALKEQVDRLTVQVACRSQKGTDLNALNGDAVGGLIDLVNLLIDHAPPEAYPPVKARLKELGAQRAAAKQAAVTAVQDCQG
jgi:hypothetical protein